MKEVNAIMNIAKERLLKLIEHISEQEVEKILEFVEYLKASKDKSLTKDLTKTSESSLDFWDNDLDDEVWNETEL